MILSIPKQVKINIAKIFSAEFENYFLEVWIKSG